MKLKNEKEALQMFCADKDCIREWWEKPFVNPWDENRIWATDSHIFIRVDNNLTGGKYESHEQFLPQLDGEECDITIPISAIEEAMKELPMIAETRIEKGDEIECPECDGTGEVTWTYEDEEGNEYELDADCPVCEGTGRTDEEKEVPTGRMIPEKNTSIVIAGIMFEAKFIKNVIDGLRLLGFDSIRQVHRTQDGANVFEVTAGVEVWIAPMFENADWSEYKTVEVRL